MLHQFVAGLVFGCAAGFFANRGMYGVCNTISTLLFVLTLLDHLGYIHTPWGWHGAGAHHHQKSLAHTGFGDVLWEFTVFVINNFMVYMIFLFFYEVSIGRVAWFQHR